MPSNDPVHETFAKIGRLLMKLETEEERRRVINALATLYALTEAPKA